MTRKLFRLCLWLCFLVFLSPAALAPAQTLVGNQKTDASPLEIQVRSYPAGVHAGQQVWIAVILNLDPGWHIYGNPKGSGPGLPTTLKASALPEGIQAGSPLFPPAERFVDPELTLQEWVWIYRGKTTLYLPLSTSGEMSPGSYRLDLHIRALLCKKGLCLPHRSRLSTRVTIVSPSEAVSSVPPSVRQGVEQAHLAESTSITLPVFGDAEESEEPAGGPPPEIPSLEPRPVHRVLEVDTLFKAVLFALVAGFILNLMPCVLPVVSLKILGFVQEARDRGQRFSFSGLSFAAGILVVFLILAALASFAGYGWGELFQKQLFVVIMIALVFGLSLSLFGVFYLPVPSFAARAESRVQSQGYWGSFYRGCLATFLATPCSGPLLGGAMAWTLRQPPPLIFSIFFCLGLGMASPFLIMALSPRTLRWLPRPGPWLVHFERLMGFALLGTCVYLLAILPTGTRVWVVLFCLFLALGLYIWGQMTTLKDSRRRRLLVRSVALLVVLAGWWLSLRVLPGGSRHEQGAQDAIQWQKYTNNKLLEAAGERWVVVDFTADWCPNCILVERTALRDSQVLKAFREHDALLLRADLTRENPAAHRLLEKLGSRSIPFLALFPPNKDCWRPYFLRDIYRAEDVLLVFSESKEPGGHTPLGPQHSPRDQLRKEST